MSAKAILVFCAQAVLIQGIYSQCIGSIGSTIAAEEYALANGLAYGNGLGLGAPFGYPAGSNLANYGVNIAPTSGGGFAVTSVSPIYPTGITVISENAIEGTLSMNGELPFLSAVAVEGALPTTGAGGISYGCGNGAVGIVSEGVSPAAYPAGPAYGAGVAGLGFGAGVGRGFGGPGFGLGGCGCNGVF